LTIFYNEVTVWMSSALSKILQRPSGEGWIILAGGPLPENHILRVLALINRAGSAIALVPKSNNLSDAEEMLSPWLDRLGWPGKAVSCEADADVEEYVSEASLILLPDLSSPEEYGDAFSRTDAGEFILGALDEGALVLAEGFAAELFGEVVDYLSSSGEQYFGPGLGWISGAVIQSHFTEVRNAAILLKRKTFFRIGIPSNTTLALGPDDLREVWGDIQPTITFGSEWVYVP
jgi:hypothetical protein